ncbi:MAG: hypothetical protein ACO242_05355 [Candidatus Fonsibacter ubiquis]
MSATKELLIECLQQQDAAEDALAAAALEVMITANLAWGNGPNQPMWAPTAWWLEGMREQAQELLEALEELQAAVNSFRS